MEELNKVPETSVEDTGVAEPAETEVETTAEPVAEVQAETVPVESRVEKAFAKRLSAEKSKLEAKLASEYDAKYGNFRKIAEIGARENGVTMDEYVADLLSQMDESPQETKLDPKYAEVLEEIVKEKSTQKEQAESAEEMQSYWKGQAQMLKDYAGITDASQIPDEVVERAIANDTPIVLEYMAWDKQNAVKNAERETIRKIAEQESPGSLASGGGASSGVDIFSLSVNDPKFEEMVQGALAPN